MILRGIFKFSSLILAISFVSGTASAQRIEQVGSKRVLIARDGLNFKLKQTWEILGERGEKTGEVLIIRQQNEKALGTITVGFAKPGFFLRLKTDHTEKERNRRLFAGLSILQSNFDVTVSQTSAGLSGGQFGLQLGADQILTPRQLLRLRLGVDLVNTKGTITNPPGCNSITDCTMWIHYLTGSLGFMFQAMPEGSKFNAGFNAGFVALLPISKHSTVIDANTINFDGGLELGAMMNFKINPITFVEFSAQRMFLRTTDTMRVSFNRYNLTWVQYF